jgi:hypothetical protein
MVYLFAQNADFNAFFEDLGWKILACFTAFRYIVWPFGIFVTLLVHIFLFWLVGPRKIPGSSDV